MSAGNTRTAGIAEKVLPHRGMLTVHAGAARRASYCEIYNEGLHDLIRYNNRAQLAVRWDPGHGFHVPELARVAAPTLQDMYKVRALKAGGTLSVQAAPAAHV